MFKKTIFMVKRQYNKAIDKCLGFSGKLDYAENQIDEQIVKLGEARTACVEANLLDKVALIEKKIIELDAKRTEFVAKRKELEAKIKVLESQKKAAILTSKINIESPDSIIGEIEDYVKHLEAEISTLDFMDSLK